MQDFDHLFSEQPRDSVPGQETLPSKLQFCLFWRSSPRSAPQPGQGWSGGGWVAVRNVILNTPSGTASLIFAKPPPELAFLSLTSSIFKMRLVMLSET